MSNHFKFGILLEDKDQDKEFFYKNTYCIERFPNHERIKVAPRINQVDLILDFLKNFESPYMCLYVLLVSRVGNDLGRYQCSYPLSYSELSEFLAKYKDYFETDGRHHIWFGSAKTKQLLIYDQHNVIFIYDDISTTTKNLNEKGFVEEKVEFPVPHTHMYNFQNDVYETEIMKYWEWRKFPLEEQDAW